METSIIIRTKNEAKWIGEVLSRLVNQTYQDFEIIIVDSGSIDETLKIVKKFPVRLVHIKSEDFTFPFALNFGCRQALAEKYFVFLSAHSLPLSATWLAAGISDFTSDKIMGAYGPVRALPNATLWEKLFFNGWLHNLMGFFSKKKIIKKYHMGVMGFTNAIIRKDLWQKYNIDENYGLGGEDGAWARYYFTKGYVAVRDISFAVYHSHGLGLLDLIRQFIYWMEIAKPRPFKNLEYRK